VPNVILAGQLKTERQRGDPEDQRGPENVQYLEPSAALRMMTHFVLIARVVERKKNGRRNAKEGRAKVQYVEPSAALRMMTHFVLIARVVERKKNGRRNAKEGHRRGKAQGPGPTVMKILDPNAGEATMGQLLMLVVSLTETEKNKKPRGEPRGHREAVAP
jgi:hypothetical protein